MSDFTHCVEPKAAVRERVPALIAAGDYGEASRILKCRADFTAREKAEVLLAGIDRQLQESGDLIRALLKVYEVVLEFKGAAVKFTRNFWLPLAKTVWKNREEVAEFLQATEDAVDHGPEGFGWQRARWLTVLDKLELSQREREDILAQMEIIWRERGLDRDETHARIRAGVAEYPLDVAAMDGSQLQGYFAHPDGVDLTTLSRTVVYQYWRAGHHHPATPRGAYYDLVKPVVARVLRACAPAGAAARTAGLAGAVPPAGHGDEPVHRRLFESRSAAAFYQALAYFTTRSRLCRYADLGLVPSPTEFAAHAFGPRPAVLVVEKAAHWVALEPLLRRHQVSGLALGGAPSLILLEYFAAGLKRHVRRWADGLDLFLVTDFDPWGAGIAGQTGALLRFHGLPLRSATQLFAPRAVAAAGLLGSDEVADRAYPLEVGTRPANYGSLVRRWLQETGGGVAGQFPGLNLPAHPPLALGYDVLGTARLLQLVERHLRR